MDICIFEIYLEPYQNFDFSFIGNYVEYNIYHDPKLLFLVRHQSIDYIYKKDKDNWIDSQLQKSLKYAVKYKENIFVVTRSIDFEKCEIVIFTYQGLGRNQNLEFQKKIDSMLKMKAFW